MAIIKCKMCGGDLNIEEGKTVATCEYCGTTQTIPNADNEKKLTLFGRAGRLLRACEFDKAAGVYESIVADFPEEAEAYWGLVLCKYGIEYVDDPSTGKKIPTSHRTSFNSLMDDPDYEQAIENTDTIGRRVYRDEAKVIEELRKGIIEVSEKETAYDVFICYKETDENGDRTIDSVLAQDIYDALVNKGYRVFFSRITLEDKLGREYEPYIFAALNSAKVMLAVGTDYEYYNAVWVKNEWSRYLKLISSGQKKVLIPCYKGIDAYDMPKEFSKLQGQDLGKIGALQDLLRGIDKILGQGTEKPQDISLENKLKEQMREQTLNQANNKIRLGIMAAKSNDLEKAIRLFEESIENNPDHVGAYLGLIWTLDFDRVKPYCEQLENFSSIEISDFIKENTGILAEKPSSILLKVIMNGGTPKLVKTLLESGANVADEFAFRQAVLSKHCLELVPLFVEHGVYVDQEYELNIEYQEYFGKQIIEIRTPLAEAVWQNKDIRLVQYLISQGAGVNHIQKNNDDCTWSILNMAIRKGNLETITLLIENGAKVNDGRWCNDIYNYYDCFAIRKKIKTNFCNLSDAIRVSKNADIVELLLKKGANPNYRYQAYHVQGILYTDQCCGLSDVINYTGDIKMLKLMLDYGADPYVTYSSSWTDSTDRRRSECVSMRELAAKKVTSEMVQVFDEYQKQKDNDKKRKELKSELESLKIELPNVKGIFAGMRQKNIQARIDAINRELEKIS